jgi:hypothetical protein
VAQSVDYIKTLDPLALKLTGKSFDGENYAGVYDHVLSKRLWAEFYDQDLPQLESERLESLATYIENHLSDLDASVAECLTSIDRPLTALSMIDPYELAEYI